MSYIELLYPCTNFSAVQWQGVSSQLEMESSVALNGSYYTDAEIRLVSSEVSQNLYAHSQDT